MQPAIKDERLCKASAEEWKSRNKTGKKFTSRMVLALTVGFFFLGAI